MLSIVEIKRRSQQSSLIQGCRKFKHAFEFQVTITFEWPIVVSSKNMSFFVKKWKVFSTLVFRLMSS